ncbi:MAG: hypothetical protein AAB470_00660 [Patescibacteria group bacterium]
MEKELYSPDLIMRKFAYLKMVDWELHMNSGDFKILIDDSSNSRPRTIIRWPNTRVFGPNQKFVSVLLLEIFHGIPEQDIIYKGILPCGFEITTR